MKIGQKFVIITQRYEKLFGTLASKENQRLIFDLVDGGYLSIYANDCKTQIFAVIK